MGSRIAILDIVELIIKLRSKIEKNKELLQNNETLTRYALIDPLLRTLGWDTEDPEQVVPEFSIESWKVDYALKVNGKAVIIIEAKPLGTPLDKKKVVNQVLTYANAGGIPYAIVTNGDKWEIYEIFKPAGLRERLIASWEITKDSPQEIALKALSIANLGGVEALGKPGHRPILIPEEKTETKTMEGPVTRKLARKLVLQILSETSKPMGRKEICEEVEKRVELTEHDLEKGKSGKMRWETIVRGTISDLFKKGLITRVGENAYVITDKGRELLKELV